MLLLAFCHLGRHKTEHLKTTSKLRTIWQSVHGLYCDCWNAFKYSFDFIDQSLARMESTGKGWTLGLLACHYHGSKTAQVNRITSLERLSASSHERGRIRQKEIHFPSLNTMKQNMKRCNFGVLDVICWNKFFRYDLLFFLWGRRHVQCSQSDVFRGLPSTSGKKSKVIVWSLKV